MIRASVLALATVQCLAACGGEASGRQPPDGLPKLEIDVVAESFACGRVPVESV